MPPLLRGLCPVFYYQPAWHDQLIVKKGKRKKKQALPLSPIHIMSSARESQTMPEWDKAGPKTDVGVRVSKERVVPALDCSSCSVFPEPSENARSCQLSLIRLNATDGPSGSGFLPGFPGPPVSRFSNNPNPFAFTGDRRPTTISRRRICRHAPARRHAVIGLILIS